MSQPTTAIGLSPTTPAPPSGNQNVVPQSDNGVPLQKISFSPQHATASLLGVVKPDGSTITVDGTGKLSAAGSSGGIIVPTAVAIRGSSVGPTTSASSVTVPLPTGSIAGDFALLFAEQGFNVSVPSGWTQVLLQNGISVNTVVASKLLTSADITAGSVTVSAGGSYFWIAAMMTFIGATGGVREVHSNNGSGGAIVDTLTTTSAVAATDAGVYFGSARSGSGGTLGISPGTSLQTATSADPFGTLADQAMPGGVTSVVFSYSGAGGGFLDCVVIVMGVSIGTGKGTTGLIGGSSLAAGATATGTATVPGAVPGQPVDVSASDGSSPALCVVSATVTAANTVTVQLMAIATTTPTAVTYNVRVIS